MRVLHVIPSLDPGDGGPSVALPLMARALANEGIEVDAAATMTDADAIAQGIRFGESVAREGFDARFFKRQTGFYKVSLPLRSWLRRHARDYDLLHIHAVFSFASLAAAGAARKATVPYIVRPLGLLNAWGMENRRRRVKALSFRLFDRPALEGAAAIHYTSEAERDEAAPLHLRSPGWVIPLGIDLAPFRAPANPEIFLQRFPLAWERKIILYLSRVNPKKGLDLLLPAFARVHAKHPQALLVIAGEGDEGYVGGLHAEAARLGIANDILWSGFLGGADKLAAFAAASVFTLPSYSENFGIALVEALAAGLACVSTTGVAVSEDVRERDAGVVVPCEVGPLADALDRLLSDAVLRSRVGANARRLAAKRFSLEAMGAALKDLYERILKEKRAA